MDAVIVQMEADEETEVQRVDITGLSLKSMLIPLHHMSFPRRKRILCDAQRWWRAASEGCPRDVTE